MMLITIVDVGLITVKENSSHVFDSTGPFVELHRLDTLSHGNHLSADPDTPVWTKIYVQKDYIIQMEDVTQNKDEKHINK